MLTRVETQTFPEMRLDLWAGDCSGYQWSNMPAVWGGEPPASSLPIQLGGSGVAIGFFRASGFLNAGMGVAPACPADAPTSIAPNLDFRFEGNSLTDSSGNNVTLVAPGSSFVNSPTYAPACSVVSSATAPRPVVPVAPFTIRSTSITSVGSGVPSTFAWTQTSGPTATIANPAAPSTSVTPSADGSYTFQLQVGDGANTSSCSFNIGVVASDADGIKLVPAELSWIIGTIPRYGTSPWPWFEQTEAVDADVLADYWAAPPAPGALFTGTGNNDAYFSGRGPFTGLTSDSYDVKISATGSPDAYEEEKRRPVERSRPHNPGVLYRKSDTVTRYDGVIVCFGGSSGHTLGDMWTRMPPQAGTASVSVAGNRTDPFTGQIMGIQGPPCNGSIEAVGTGTSWATGTPAQALKSGNYYWFEWDYANDGSNQGRFFSQLNAVVDDTHVCVGGNGGNWPIPAAQSSAIAVRPWYRS